MDKRHDTERLQDRREERREEQLEVRLSVCVVCGDESEFVTVRVGRAEDELMCTRCGQARLVPALGSATLRSAADRVA